MTETSKATRKDLDAIRGLLEANTLPALPGEIPLSNVLVILGEGSVVGAIALEAAAAACCAPPWSRRLTRARASARPWLRASSRARTSWGCASSTW